MLMLSCGTDPKSVPTETSPVTNGCESINWYPTSDEQWSSLCYCIETDEAFTQCIDDWASWHRNKHPSPSGMDSVFQTGDREFDSRRVLQGLPTYG